MTTLLEIPKMTVIRKDVTRAKVTISETRFDIKIPLNMSEQDEQSVIKHFVKVCEETWHPRMTTHREQFSN